jgi:hypothetical protein
MGLKSTSRGLAGSPQQHITSDVRILEAARHSRSTKAPGGVRCGHAEPNQSKGLLSTGWASKQASLWRCSIGKEEARPRGERQASSDSQCPNAEPSRAVLTNLHQPQLVPAPFEGLLFWSNR